MRSLKRIFTCIAPILLIACMVSSKTPTPVFVDQVSLPKPLTAKAMLFTNNNLIIEISGVIDRQGYVYAEYWLGSNLRTGYRLTQMVPYRTNLCGEDVIAVLQSKIGAMAIL